MEALGQGPLYLTMSTQSWRGKGNPAREDASLAHRKRHGTRATWGENPQTGQIRPPYSKSGEYNGPSRDPYEPMISRRKAHTSSTTRSSSDRKME